jgi:hypothetical protein
MVCLHAHTHAHTHTHTHTHTRAHTHTPGVQATVDINSGWAGFATQYLTRMQEDHGNVPVLTWGQLCVRVCVCVCACVCVCVVDLGMCRC